MSAFDRNILITQPRLLAFGVGCASRCAQELNARGAKRVFVATSRSARQHLETAIPQSAFKGQIVCHDVPPEPTVAHFREALDVATHATPDAVVGLGGGSALDVSKLIAALCRSDQDVTDAFGIEQLRGPRSIFLACLPTTSGTGSEVSPNAILLDEATKLKKGVISPHLVPDAAIVDPALTVTCPPTITAATGLDALTHCIEAYANKLAHPIIDTYALEGIGAIAKSLRRAYSNGSDLEARTLMSMGSLYGGLCLGPVNTGAIHALSYPLGSEFHIPHGVANALLAPHVMRFNLPFAREKYDMVAIAMQLHSGRPHTQWAEAAIDHIAELILECGVPPRLRDLNIPRDAIPRMADAALTITRLLDRNVRTVTRADAIDIYEKAY